jgi:DNA-directed RNA polymerase sigma subunit (sigma70/sigma32)
MTYRVDKLYTLEIVRNDALDVRASEAQLASMRAQRDLSARFCYNAGNATLQQLADATGLTRQRIQQIVRERGDR